MALIGLVVYLFDVYVEVVAMSAIIDFPNSYQNPSDGMMNP